MTDRELAEAVAMAIALTRRCQQHYRERSRVGDEGEADTALAAFRLAMPLKRALESWIQDRAMHAALRTA